VYPQRMVQADRIQVALMEDLFQVQTNAFRLINHKLYLKTPVLAAVAAFGWLIPIATIYPPGALIIGLEDSTISRSLNVSIFHQKSLSDVSKLSSIAPILCIDPDNADGTVDPSLPEVAQNASLMQGCQVVVGPRFVVFFIATLWRPNSISSSVTGIDQLDYVAGSSLISGEIARFHHPGGGNVSYALQFWGTILECELKKNLTTLTPIETADLHFGDLNFTTILDQPLKSNFTMLHREPQYTTSFQDAAITWRITRHALTYKYFPCLQDPSQPTASVNTSSSTIQLIVPIEETICRPKIARYNVHVSYASGIQHVSYSLEENSSLPTYISDYKHFVHFFDVLRCMTGLRHYLTLQTITRKKGVLIPLNTQKPRLLTNWITVQSWIHVY
jgi:hypothetical protein